MEDELLASNRLLRMIEEVDPSIEVCHVFKSIKETATFLKDTVVKIDLLFLDIHVTDGNSFDLFNVVDIQAKVIFITAYDAYAIEAFRKRAIDYLLKPVKKDLLKEAISRARPIPEDTEIGDMVGGYKNRFLIRFGRKLHSLKTSDIAYIYSQNKISYFYTREGNRFPSDYKLQELEESLNPSSFFRLNRQFIVHIDSINSMHRHDASRLKVTLKPAIE